MLCGVCGSESPNGKKFCGECGASLQKDDALTSVVQREAERILASKLKDQKLVEVEITQGIVARLSDWAKLFGFFVGIPLALLTLVLGALGLRTYSDFVTQVKAAREEALRPLQDTKKEADRIARAYKDLSAQLESTGALAAKVDTLSQKVAKIEEVVNFKPSASLTPSLRKNIEDVFRNYYDYLKSVGFVLAGPPPTVSVSRLQDLNSYYQPSENQIVIDEELAKLPYPGLREYTHYILFSLKKDAFNLGDKTGLESGLADYFPSSFSGQSDFGKDVWALYRKRYGDIKIERNLENQRRFSEIKAGQTEEHEAGNVWGGAFWQIRQAIGKPATDALLLQGWNNCDLKTSLSDLLAFPRELLKQDDRLNRGKYSPQIKEVFRVRGLVL